jgi:hypothetical protein
MQVEDYYSKFIIESYDAVVGEHGDDPTVVAEVFGDVEARVSRAIMSGEIAPIELTQRDAILLRMQLVLPKERKRRRSSFPKDLEYLGDAIANPLEAANMDAILSRAMPLGDGTDKVLACWNGRDYERAVKVRYRNAADATAKAAQFDNLTMPILDALDSRHAHTTRDLFWKDAA